MKKIGVIGLSEGQSVALTMSMERVYGTLRIADFDHCLLIDDNPVDRFVNQKLLEHHKVARNITNLWW